MDNEEDPFWGKDPLILVEPEAITELLPSQQMTVAERYNAVARVTILVSLLLALWRKKWWPVAAGAVILALSYLLFQRQEEKQMPAQAQVQVQAEGTRRKRKRRARRFFGKDETYFPPLEQPFIQQETQYARPGPQQQMTLGSQPTPNYGLELKDGNSIGRQEPTRPEMSFSDGELWRKFVAGPGVNGINGQSGLEQRGVNASHGASPTHEFGPVGASGAPLPDGPAPNAGFGLDGENPLGGGTVPDLQCSAVPSNFESKRLPVQNAFYGTDGPTEFPNIGQPMGIRGIPKPQRADPSRNQALQQLAQGFAQQGPAQGFAQQGSQLAGTMMMFQGQDEHAQVPAQGQGQGQGLGPAAQGQTQGQAQQGWHNWDRYEIGQIPVDAPNLQQQFQSDQMPQYSAQGVDAQMGGVRAGYGTSYASNAYDKNIAQDGIYSMNGGFQQGQQSQGFEGQSQGSDFQGQGQGQGYGPVGTFAALQQSPPGQTFMPGGALPQGVPQPVCRPFDQLSKSEQMNYVAREKRDHFLDRLFLDVDELMNERQFSTLPNYNQFEDRDAAIDALYGKDSLGFSTFRDPLTNFYEKYYKR